jgi:hypothetical protein
LLVKGTETFSSFLLAIHMLPSIQSDFLQASPTILHQKPGLFNEGTSSFFIFPKKQGTHRFVFILPFVEKKYRKSFFSLIVHMRVLRLE